MLAPLAALIRAESSDASRIALIDYGNAFDALPALPEEPAIHWAAPLGRQAAYHHDVLDREVLRVDPLGNRTTFVCNAVNLLIETVDPTGGSGNSHATRCIA